MHIQVARYSLVTSIIEDGIEHSIITSNKPSESSCTDCQVYTYFSHERRSRFYLLNLDSFPKESHETEVESIMITPSVSSFSGCLNFIP